MRCGRNLRSACLSRLQGVYRGLTRAAQCQATFTPDKTIVHSARGLLIFTSALCRDGAQGAFEVASRVKIKVGASGDGPA